MSPPRTSHCSASVAPHARLLTLLHTHPSRCSFLTMLAFFANPRNRIDPPKVRLPFGLHWPAASGSPASGGGGGGGRVAARAGRTESDQEAPFS